MIGRIEPKASNGHHFIIVAIDYFTKWVKAASYANVTKQVVVRFIKNQIIYCYVVHNKIITDNGTNLTDLCHGQLYQKRMKQAFGKKVRPREFMEGDLVLKKILSFQPDSRGKWTPNYEGAYVVKRAFSGGALTLATMDGDEIPRPVNTDAVKK
ncbi:uncharacterized protein [Medicago truncatula]|uniref:uncharacterized protein n=1 Tax=Medicago truncatula TaxID=3880 RepID=UPI000D2F26AB|nr:uncharacterized protein LOC112420779 [Medicago truncatula]